MSHLHFSPHVHQDSECSYEHDAFGVHIWCSDPSDGGGLCHGCQSRIAEQLSETGTVGPITLPAAPYPQNERSSE